VIQKQVEYPPVSPALFQLGPLVQVPASASLTEADVGDYTLSLFADDVACRTNLAAIRKILTPAQ
jgi:hypothetical protein